jgi:serine phosphatase RsbU (regulator of sigma subunit)
MSILASHILIVDDIADNRNILVRRLQRLGYTNLAESEDGIAALEHIRAGAVDLVLLDVMMPRLNGVEVLQALKSEGRLEATSVIMISASSEIDTVVSCLELGAEDYLPKPFNPAILRARIGSVLEKKQLRSEVRRQLARLEAEMAVARSQQLAMVPTHFPRTGTFDLHAIMRPALEVGGDLYDFFEISPDTLCIAIGDVSGKGMPAALFMARTRSLLRAGALQHHAITGRLPRPAELAALLNDELCKNNDGCLFVTLLAGFLHLPTGTFSFVNAGHLPPLRLGPTDAVEVACAIDPPLGAMEDTDFHDNRIVLDEGDALVLITDGLSEMEDVGQVMYTTPRLVGDLVGMAGADARTIVEHLVARIFDHAGEAAQFDDVTVLALRATRPA